MNEGVGRPEKVLIEKVASLLGFGGVSQPSRGGKGHSKQKWEMISTLYTGGTWSPAPRDHRAPGPLTDRPPDQTLDFWTKEISWKEHIYFRTRIMSFPEGSENR